jgi:hypothetical protein
MQEYAVENASLRLLSRHYASGQISLAEYRIARHAMLQALEAGQPAPELPVLDEVAEEPAQATMTHTPFAESGEWQVDATTMTAALAPPPPVAPEPVRPDGVVAESVERVQMSANSWILLVILLGVAVIVALGILFYVFRL